MKHENYLQKQNDFISVLLRRTISASIDPSALRNQGARNMVSAARKYLQTVNFKRLTAKDRSDFVKQLDFHTKQLVGKFPKEAPNWGAARKAINLVFRDVLYNTYLCKEFGLEKFENWLELPLDSYVAKGIRKASTVILPKWSGIKNLSKTDNEAYQMEARRIAELMRLAPVHLDIYLWRNIGRVERL